MNPIQHEETGKRGTFFIEENDARVAEMTYSRAEEGVIVIDHTQVDEERRGKGVGKSLVNASVKWARDNDTKIMATCPFATAQLKADSSMRDVLA